jgi:shikimate dehydrogenase
MNQKKIRLGLVGKDVSKSDSERIHRFILNEWGVACDYENISVNAEEFDSAARYLMGDFDGFNVTIPYKRDIMCYLDGMQGDALVYGAVNTVTTNDRQGFNTDGVGFLLMLRAANIPFENKKILILGAGGAGRSSAVALKNAGAEVFLYQRNKEKLAEVCQELAMHAASDPESGGYDIVINSTGVGMHETVGISPVRKAAFQGAESAIDLIYKPAESEFLRLAKQAGLRTLNGEAMLFYQAYYSDCIYLNRTADENEAKALYKKYLATNA